MAKKLNLRVILIIIAIAAVIGAPFLSDQFIVYLLTQAFLYAVLAISLDLIWGYTGILNLGHSLWFGIGALAVGMMTTTVSESGMVTSIHGSWLTYLAAIFSGIILSAFVASLVAWYSFSTRGSSHFYIAIVSLALAAGLENYLFSSAKMSTSLVSGMNSSPMTKVPSATTIGYHRPE